MEGGDAGEGGVSPVPKCRGGLRQQQPIHHHWWEDRGDNRVRCGDCDGIVMQFLPESYYFFQVKRERLLSSRSEEWGSNTGV